MTLSPNGQYITITFDPGGVADVPLCDSLMFVQVVHPQLEDSQGGRTTLTYSQRGGVAEAVRYDSLLTTAGYRVDADPNDHVPYYVSPDPGFVISHIGNKFDLTWVPADMTDNPNDPFGYFRQAATVMDFEVNVFCAAGAGQGQWLGRATWTWRQPFHAFDTITPGSTSRATPSAAFVDALTRFSTLRGFVLPSVPQPRKQGGVACN